MTLARSLDRLNFVIASAGRRPQDVLLAVRASGGEDRCPFVWTDGTGCVDLSQRHDYELRNGYAFPLRRGGGTAPYGPDAITWCDPRGRRTAQSAASSQAMVNGAPSTSRRAGLRLKRAIARLSLE